MLKSLREKLFRAGTVSGSVYHLDTRAGHVVSLGVSLFADSPLYWKERADELKALTTVQPANEKTAARKYADLQAVIESLKSERKAYLTAPNIHEEARRLADRELVKLSLAVVREIKTLREAYPSLTSETSELTEPTSSRQAVKEAASAAFNAAAAKTAEWSQDLLTNPHLRKYSALAAKALKAAAARVTNDLKEISAPLRQDMSDAIQDTRLAIREQLEAIPVIRNIDWDNPKHRRMTTNAASYVAIFGLVAGVASHIADPTAEADKIASTPETKPITFKFEPPHVAKANEDIFTRPTIKDGYHPHRTHYKYATRPQKAAPVYVAARKDFSEDSFYSFDDETTREARKNLKGHKMSTWNWDALLKPKYREILVGATQRLLNMHPSDVFHKGLLMTESGGRQFDDKGRVVVSHAGATGAAQVLPNTASLIAEKCTGETIDWIRFRTDRDYNVKMGKCYFKEQHETFGNNNVAALLAYNSGPGSDTRNTGLKYNLRKSGISLSNDGRDMVDLISSIRNTENRHYALITMAKLGLIDPNDLGEDVTRGNRTRSAPRYGDSGQGSYKSAGWEEKQGSREPSALRYEFQRGAQILKDDDNPPHQQEDRTSLLMNSEDPIARAATLD